MCVCTRARACERVCVLARARVCVLVCVCVCGGGGDVCVSLLVCVVSVVERCERINKKKSERKN